MITNRLRVLSHIFADHLHERVMRKELFVRLGVEGAKRLKLRQVHVEVLQVEACKRFHVYLVEDQVFLNQSWTREVNRVCHNER